MDDGRRRDEVWRMLQRPVRPKRQRCTSVDAPLSAQVGRWRNSVYGEKQIWFNCRASAAPPPTPAFSSTIRALTPAGCAAAEATTWSERPLSTSPVPKRPVASQSSVRGQSSGFSRQAHSTLRKKKNRKEGGHAPPLTLLQHSPPLSGRHMPFSLSYGG
jgi:hypothetical protein